MPSNSSRGGRRTRGPSTADVAWVPRACYLTIKLKMREFGVQQERLLR